MRSYLAGHRYGFFDEAEIKLLCTAFDEAWLIVQASPHEYILSDNAELLRETLAASVVNAAVVGERDPLRLRTVGLSSITTSLT